MANPRIAVSTGKIDKRCVNGNNNTRRGKDKKKRKMPERFVLKDEVKAGLRARLDMLLEHYGTKAEMARRLGYGATTVAKWFENGMISPEGARRVQRDYKKNNYCGYRATFCRPDIRFDDNGRPLEKRCSNKSMLVIKKSTKSKTDES